MNNLSVTGFWKIKSSRVRNEDGSWFVDAISGGRVAFSEVDNFCIFFRSTQGTWGYSGTYRIDEQKLFVTVDACTAEDVEGQKLARDIVVINADEFIYRGVEFHTGRVFEAHLFRVS